MLRLRHCRKVPGPAESTALPRKRRACSFVVSFSISCTIFISFFVGALLVRDRKVKCRQQQERSVQQGPDFLNIFLDVFVPFYQPNQYAIQPIDAFWLYIMCIDSSRVGCNEANTIRFTNSENPARNEFRYHDSGPLQIQGVFWAQQDALPNQVPIIANIIDLSTSELITFARTRHGSGVHTGVLQTDANGYEYVQRPVGDHSWSTSENSPDTYVSTLDPLYLYDITEGTLEDPREFVITTSVKLWFECLRFNFGDFGNFFSRFDMRLVTDPNNPLRVRYPGSQIWIRRSTYIGIFYFEYNVIQVVDGNGQKIEAAWNEFRDLTYATIVPGLKEDRTNDRVTC